MTAPDQADDVTVSPHERKGDKVVLSTVHGRYTTSLTVTWDEARRLHTELGAVLEARNVAAAAAADAPETDPHAADDLSAWRLARLQQAEASGEVLRLTGPRSLLTPGPDR